MFGKETKRILLISLPRCYLGYSKYQEIQAIDHRKISSLGFIKNSKKMTLMQQNIDYCVNLMICHMVRYIQPCLEGHTYLFNPFLARTIRSISCHSFPANQRSDSVKRSSTEQQMNPGRHCPELNPLLQSTDLLENALYLTEIFTLTSSPKKLQLSTISLDSIDKDQDRFDLFLYDSLNDESEDDHQEQFHDCSNDINLLNTLVNQRRLIEQLTQRCSSLDSLDNDETKLSTSRMRVLSMNDACVENFPRLDLLCD